MDGSLWRRSQFERTDVDATIHQARKPAVVALIVEQRRIESIGIKVGIAGVDGRAVHQQRMRHSCPAVILQWADQRVGVANVAGPVRPTARAGRAVSTCSVVAEVVTEGYDRAVRTDSPVKVGIKDGI